MKRQAKIRQTLVRLALAWAMAVACMMSAPRARAQAEEGSDALVPKAVELSAAAQAAINAEFLSEEEKRDLRIAHGVWTDADLDTAARRAAAALQIWDLGAEALSDPAIPAELRAEAMLQRGNLEEAAATASTSGSARAARIRCEALLLLGKFAEADEALTATLQAAGHGDIKSADELTEAARCLALRARLRGEGGSTYQATMGMLGEVSQRLDRMHPGAKLAEGQLLYEKDNTEEAVTALHEALGLNPRLSQAWYQLGLIALDTYDFGSADDAIAALRAVNRDHPLATLLAVRAALVQNMPDEAAKTLGPMREKYPAMREAMALTAAIAATRYDQAGMAQALADMEAISPGSGYGHATAGHFLAGNRQYDLAATTLREAIRRESGWATPQIDLGLMLVQAARDDEARQVLGRVAELDPFNEAARFSLKLLNDISAYAVIETPHFVIRYDPQTTDGLLAEEMKAPLEKIYADITGVFGHEPAQKTVIELQPNHARFAVRITGMPELHTIAASTGPLIAVESPRAGAGHFGLFDWARVVRHEYVHTVNLSHTNNRIPHWLTEAAAVWQESAPRDERTCLMLVQAYETDRLFDLDEINWAFVRPKRAGDRGLAYAQGHWMFEYMVETFGLDRMRALMGEYAKGQAEAAALPAALGGDITQRRRWRPCWRRSTVSRFRPACLRRMWTDCWSGIRAIRTCWKRRSRCCRLERA